MRPEFGPDRRFKIPPPVVAILAAAGCSLLGFWGYLNYANQPDSGGFEPTGTPTPALDDPDLFPTAGPQPGTEAIPGVEPSGCRSIVRGDTMSKLWQRIKSPFVYTNRYGESVIINSQEDAESSRFDLIHVGEQICLLSDDSSSSPVTGNEFPEEAGGGRGETEWMCEPVGAGETVEGVVRRGFRDPNEIESGPFWVYPHELSGPTVVGSIEEAHDLAVPGRSQICIGGDTSPLKDDVNRKLAPNPSLADINGAITPKNKRPSLPPLQRMGTVYQR